MRLKIQGFYEAFISAIYGFVLVFGFEHFVSLQSGHHLTFLSYVLFATAYLNLLHFWLVFFAATEETFDLVYSRQSDPERLRMFWFWTELIFATLFSLPMLRMFASVNDTANFAAAMVLTAALSLLWDVWAFTLERYISKQDKDAIPMSARLLLLRWTGLDILFLAVTVLLLIVVRSKRVDAQPLDIAFALFGISALGAILDTIIVNPNAYLDKKH